MHQNEDGDVSQGGIAGSGSHFQPKQLSQYLEHTYLPPGTKLFPMKEAGDHPNLKASPLRITVGNAGSVEPLNHPWAIAVNAGL